ncbi:DNA primase [Vibrio alginolyticus]|uniref:DNA primase n=1 Tax=Vibrio sp. B1FLJ16 TaxID=2751178 RepID=UPI0015F5F0C2|nr:DNA primase [Vibrio sp. B1FLJ16]CAD7798737.1 RNA polymerase that catalyzes the synthesis of short RNA molecules used as primers for DNA polymerase during DNA replication [Vibrio sp. B1FLJ16]CAD7798763.1 RNA polymerase that catalyzes the synthesis of short RNA molecules used as primers for DNA polymerase during DNA replication [Vibrio sp. B1FLJ16]CAE6883542.1 RNA polymerase that catalyzes the synthesis of short RNA molecules used as primers for DNA polymerase during DNA replication [Vibrio sp.
MAGHIPRSFIDDLLARLDIVDIIDARVKLKKKGKNYGACCPFHNEKTPSFSVSQEKQFYHCFGCGVHGNAIDFIMEFERLDFVEAIEELASYLGLDVPREQRSGGGGQFQSGPQASSSEKRNLYDLMGSIAQFYRNQLKLPASKVAIEYLKDRGLSGEIVQKFGIGYVADEWDLVRKNFGQQKDAQDMLVTGGMLIENDKGNRYDRFRGRVMFPIRDRRGRVIGFGGRVLGDGTPKYLNSPETPIFHKGKELYGLYEVLQAYREPPRVLVVEGYMDVVALAQYGVDYSVASLGTSTTGDHIQMLFRQTNTVVCCYDGDRAGKEAAWRALENALQYLKTGNTLKFLFLPDGEDPDSYVRKYGKDAFEQQIEQATPLSNYLFDNLIELHQINLGNNEGKSALRAYASALIDKIPDPYFQELLEKLLDERTGFDNRLRQARKKVNEARPQPHKEIKRTPMREVIALLIQNPSYAQMVPDLASVRDLSIPGLSLFVDVLEKCSAHPNINTGQLLEHWRNSQNEALLSRLASWDIPLDEDNQEEIFLDSLDKIIAQCVEKQIENLQAKARSVGLSAEEKRELLALMLDLKA